MTFWQLVREVVRWPREFTEALAGRDAYEQGYRAGCDSARKATEQQLDDAYLVGFSDGKTAKEIERLSSAIPDRVDGSDLVIAGRVIGSFRGTTFQPSGLMHHNEKTTT